MDGSDGAERSIVADAAQPLGTQAAPSGKVDENGHRSAPPDWGESLEEAAKDAEALAARLADLVRHRPSSDNEEQLRSLESRLEQIEGKLRGLRGILTEPGDLGNLADLAALLEAWRQKPNDLLIMVKVAEKADCLASLVRHYEQIVTMVVEG